jgi:type I restriction enzyme S subunit
MSVPMLIEEFELLTAAPNGVQKLRELVLSLAVRGKLVPQDPKDEPASELLKQTRAEKAKLFSPVGVDEKPFSLPAKWEWARFESIFSLEYGDNLPAPKRTNSGEYPVYGSNGVVGTHSECCVKQPCIVVGRKGSAGALNLGLQAGCWVTDVAYYCIPPAEMDLEFCFKLFHTIGLAELGKGIKPGLSRSEAYQIPVAVPPLAEQHRIVVKVDELMALCDQLEAQLTAARELSSKLVAVVAEARLAQG